MHRFFLDSETGKWKSTREESINFFFFAAFDGNFDPIEDGKALILDLKRQPNISGILLKEATQMAQNYEQAGKKLRSDAERRINDSNRGK